MAFYTEKRAGTAISAYNCMMTHLLPGDYLSHSKANKLGLVQVEPTAQMQPLVQRISKCDSAGSVTAHNVKWLVWAVVGNTGLTPAKGIG